MKKIIIFGILLLLSCQDFQQKENLFFDESPIIMLYPCNGFSEEKAWSISDKITNYFKREFGITIQTMVEQEINLPNSLMNNKKTRYNATKIIEYFQCNSDIIQIVLLNQDIFKYKENGSEWGILGQSIIGGNTCVASSYRLKNKDNMWKLVLHEYCHTKFKYHHCPNNDPKCFMKDAKGKANLEIQNYFCNSCRKIIK